MKENSKIKITAEFTIENIGKEDLDIEGLKGDLVSTMEEWFETSEVYVEKFTVE